MVFVFVNTHLIIYRLLLVNRGVFLMRKFYISCYDILIIAILLIVLNANNIAYANKFNVSTNKFENESVQKLSKEVFLTLNNTN